MVTQLADARLGDPRAVYEPAERSVPGFNSVVAEGNRWMTAAQGITVSVLIALPFWSLIAFLVYWVLYIL
jgi:hypothetical protein